MKNIVAPLDNEFVGAPNKEFRGDTPPPLDKKICGAPDKEFSGAPRYRIMLLPPMCLSTKWAQGESLAGRKIM